MDRLALVCYNIILSTAQEWRYSLVDINECTRGTHNCVQRCTNTLGSFTCACNSGHRLASNGRSCNGKFSQCTPLRKIYLPLSQISTNAQKTLTTVLSGAQTLWDPSPAHATLASDWTVTGGPAVVSSARNHHVHIHLLSFIPDINECTERSHNCEQTCRNTAGSFTCSCNSGFTLAANGRSCTPDSVEPLCGGRLTAASGSFQTPGWPANYPDDNFQCEWVIDIPNNGATIEFTLDDSAFGINGRSPCVIDNIEFFDGLGSNANSLKQICGHIRFNDLSVSIVTTGSEARVVFTGTDRPRPTSRVGVKVDYRTITSQTTTPLTSKQGASLFY